MDCTQIDAVLSERVRRTCESSGMVTSRVGAVAALIVAVGALGGVRVTGAANAVTAPAPPASSARWDWPLSPPQITAPFQAPATPYAAGHRGIDIAAVPGQAVVAPTGGVLTVAQVVVDRPVVTIKVGDDVLISMEPVTAGVPIGTSVAARQHIGVVARGGHCDDACVHLGVRVDGEYVSPLLFLAGVPAAVLLPLD